MDDQHDTVTLVPDCNVVEQKAKLKPPRMYRVVLLNDDYTPMDFVIEVLQNFFSMGREKAAQIMLMVHTQGKAICGVFTCDIAQTKAHQVNQYAKKEEYPLLAKVEVD